MESKLAKAAERALIAATQKLSPTQRLEAFLAHSRLIAALHAAGRLQRGGASPMPTRERTDVGEDPRGR